MGKGLLRPTAIILPAISGWESSSVGHLDSMGLRRRLKDHMTFKSILWSVNHLLGGYTIEGQTFHSLVLAIGIYIEV